jgi:hypothetical protein
MRQYTILNLMGLVLGVAVAVAALRNANDYWAGGLLLATPFLLGVVALGAVYDSGRGRAGRLGFVVMGGGYFALAFLGLSDRNLPKLPTTWLMAYVEDRVWPAAYTVTFTGVAPGRAVPGNVVLSNVTAGPTANTITTTTTSLISGPNAVSVDTSSRWRLLLPGARNRDAFSAVGHCLFAVLAGLLGMVIARRYDARQERAAQADAAME